MSHPTLSSTRCELQWAAWRCLGVTPSLMRSDCQLRAFNAEVTGSCTIALSPCFHSCPSTLVPPFGGWRGWLRWIAYCPFFSRQESPRTRRSSAISPSSCGPSLVILERFPPRLGTRAYYSKWVEAPRSFGPTIMFTFIFSPSSSNHWLQPYTYIKKEGTFWIIFSNINLWNRFD